MRTIHAADLFCGAGGTSTGLLNAAGKLGRQVKLIAVNHWQVAIDTHQANHPHARHLATGLESVTPADVVPGGKLDLLWASPSCTHHSVARGGKPRCNQSRAQPHLILDWLDQLYVKRLLIENVPAFTSWGPLGANGLPLKSKTGVLFEDYLRSLEARGYRWEWRILCCADYGDPTTRERFFLQAVRGRERIRWPEPTHAKNPGGMFGLQRWVPAREIIDWNIPGKSIFRRVRPLAANTMRRIEAGIRKYWGEWAEPFLVVLRGTRGGSLERTAFNLDAPLPTVTASGRHVALVEPFIVPQHAGGATRGMGQPIPAIMTDGAHALVEPFLTTVAHGNPDGNFDRRVHSLGDPVRTVTGAGDQAIVEPFIITAGGPSGQGRQPHRLGEPVGTITASDRRALVEPFLVSFYGQGQAHSVHEPFATITTKDRFGLVQQYGLDILFRMLQPHELARAHSFPDDYRFSGTKTDIVKQIGNSVPSKTSEALCLAALADSA